MLGLKWTGGLVAQLTPPGVSNENVRVQNSDPPPLV